MRRHGTRILLAIAVAVPQVVGNHVQSAEATTDKLEVESTFTFTVDPSAGRVHVHADFRITNKDVLGRNTEDLTYDHLQFAVSSAATPPAAFANIAHHEGPGNSPLVETVRARPVVEKGPGLSAATTLYELQFTPLPFWTYATGWMDYDLIGTPRTAHHVRINGAYATFPLEAIGDSGRSALNVVVPEGFTLDNLGDKWTSSTANGLTTWSLAAADNVFGGGWVVARNDAALTEVDAAASDGQQFTVHAWPGDADWKSFVTAAITDGVPALQNEIGQPWPISETVDIRESTAPEESGYAGWFDTKQHEIQIGEALDQDVLLHELSHAWFNGGWLDERWINEGLAQVYARMTVTELGGTTDPPTHADVNDTNSVALNEWSNPTPAAADHDREVYGYNTAFDVMQQIVDEVGADTMREVFAMVADDAIAYQGDRGTDKDDGTTDWRRFLDLVEVVGGSEAAPDLFDTYVVSDADLDSLDDRRHALQAYRKLADHGGDWTPPLVIRQAMSDWDFAAASSLIGSAEEVLDLRDQLDTALAEIGATEPDAVSAAYETADKGLTAAKNAVQDALDAVDTLLAAHKAATGSHGVLGTIGVINDDIDETMAAAKAAFAKGDYDTASKKANQVIDDVDSATATGLLRVVTLLAVVIAAVLFLRRRRRLAALATPSPDPDAVTPPSAEPE